MESFRYFPFFEKNIVDRDDFSNKVTDFETLGLSSFITCTGNENSLWLGSGDGNIIEFSILDGSFTISEIWKAYEMTVFDIKYCQNTLITIGIDKKSVWKIKMYDCEDGYIISKNIEKYHEIPIYEDLGSRSITVFDICNDSQIIGLGTMDDFGVYILYGNFFGKLNYLKYMIELSEPCTGIHFISTNNDNKYYVMICTKSSVSSYLIDTYTKVPKLIFCDNMGGSKLNCNVLAPGWINENDDIQRILVIFRDEGLFCYHPIYGHWSALPTSYSNPIFLASYKYYLILVSASICEVNNDNNNTSLCDVTICHYLPDLRCICYTGEFNNVSHIIYGLNQLFILCSGNVKSLNSSNDKITTTPNLLFYLTELSLYDRIMMFVKKCLFDWALIIAANEKAPECVYGQIQRTYGNWLCNVKHDFNEALSLYLKCLDTFSGDTSHVIYNFLANNRFDEVIIYLKHCIHIYRYESKNTKNRTSLKSNITFPIGKDHINLLYRLLSQLDRMDELFTFLTDEKQNETIDSGEIETAIEMCRSYKKYDIAIQIAEHFEQHEKLISIYIEDKSCPIEALIYLQQTFLEDTQKLALILKFGPTLINKIHKETTEFIKSLVINHCMSIDVFLPIFINQDKYLLDMTWDILTDNCTKSELNIEDMNIISQEMCIYLLQVSLRQKEINEIWPQKLLERLSKFDNFSNWHSVLCICSHYNYNKGILYIAQHCGLYQLALIQYFRNKDLNGLIEFCMQFGNKETFLWLESLNYIIGMICNGYCSQDYLDILINIIQQIYINKLLSPLSILDIFPKYLSNIENQDIINKIPLGCIKQLLIQEIQESPDLTKENQSSINSDREEIIKMRKDIKDMSSNPKILHSTRCNQCHLPLELPTIHFFCDHSFHRYCLVQQDQCPLCTPEYIRRIKLLRQRESNHANKDQFFKFLKGDMNNNGLDYIAKCIGVSFK
ncbi:hypothetical protein cand_001780 [Cryptosporidium andersoni]|uniref:RING-type domain-containing protein n=1 Tax=Cryptosporidium andersoni TaxID=117008 RepID=A0A1J4MQC2_9CRYT|nr:hypothetical protein cand_001780 [Cryptosporidium andersoni]